MGIAALIGGATAGVSAYQFGERGWDLVADIAGGAIFGAAIGATIALGGAAGLTATGVANTRNIANNMVGLSDDGAKAIGAITKATNRRFLNQISTKGMQVTLNRWGKIAFEAIQSAKPGTMKMLFMQSARNIAIYTPFANVVAGGLNHGYKVWGGI